MPSQKHHFYFTTTPISYGFLIVAWPFYFLSGISRGIPIKNGTLGIPVVRGRILGCVGAYAPTHPKIRGPTTANPKEP